MRCKHRAKDKMAEGQMQDGTGKRQKGRNKMHPAKRQRTSRADMSWEGRGQLEVRKRVKRQGPCGQINGEHMAKSKRQDDRCNMRDGSGKGKKTETNT